MAPDEITPESLDENPMGIFPGTDDAEVPPAVAETVGPGYGSFLRPDPIDPYASYSDETKILLSKLDTIIIELQEIKATGTATNNGVNWIGQNFQQLLQMVSKIGGNPVALLKMLKGGA